MLHLRATESTYACVEGNLHQLQALNLPNLSVCPCIRRENTHNALMRGNPLSKALLGCIVDPTTLARGLSGLLLLRLARCHGVGCHTR